MLVILYSSLILPYLNYGILAWGNSHQTLLDKLLLLQKKSLRIIFHLHPRAHTDSLFYENKILKINDLHTFQLGQFMFNYNNNNLPNVFHDIFFRNNRVHNYPTRRSNEFHLPLLRTLHCQKTFVYTGPKLWNSLIDTIKEVNRLVVFKAKLKQHLIESYKTQ